ncbi:MAG TPA: argininosuccinate synthase [Elusimicrobiota bacterium]|jgi:argininosuccinate synthase|nr:argininosuccinate synthase [Elusimicrobiota bacterium]HMX93893.1 argininosuccinate synthase [Elusimicrobiota bacterium]HMZ25941.1 argininosuccinate synthase [Elusimicrobiota bacterium]HNA61017.1 argininosuccinate synthase [Elusimicrobiota bacterium]HNC73309.1 argininosuccinate synthase [Elusimicrobiota bacterium]
MKNYKKVVVAYSGGLDTSVMLKWVREHYHCDVIACCVDVGQAENYPKLKARALATGASKAYVVDARKEFVENFIWPTLKAQALYEGRYLLGTSIARPIIAEKVAEIARREKADAVSHGATGKGNDQVRFELTFKAVAPELGIIAPWREWDMKGREDEIAYAERHKIPVTVTKKKPYSSDANLWHISYEGGVLEDPDHPYKNDMFELTVAPEDAPNRPETVSIAFEKGIPVAVNGKRLGAVALVQTLNKIAGRNGIGRVDIVENRLVGMKSRGVYEAPGATLLYFAHRELESLVLDRETAHAKELIGPRYAELVYYGQWHVPFRRALDAFVNETQKVVTGVVRLKLYKGNIVVQGRTSPHSLYWQKLASFEAEDIYNQSDAEGFINLFGLPIKVAALLKRGAGRK